jgi:hypothetical protein
MPSKDKKTPKPVVETINSDMEQIDNEPQQLTDQLAKVTKEKEPVPESGQEDIAENKSEFESYEEIAKAKKELLAIIKQSYARLTNLEKEGDRFHAKTAKEAKKKNKRNNSDPNKKPSGFETPVLIPEKFFKFISSGLKKAKFSKEKMEELEEKNYQIDSMIPRSIVTRMVYDYIKHLNLYEESTDKNKRFIKPDESIKTLFSMTDDEKIGFFNFQTYVCRLFPKTLKLKKSEEEDEEDEEEVEEVEEIEEVEEVKEPEPVKKKNGKSKTVTASV